MTEDPTVRHVLEALYSYQAEKAKSKYECWFCGEETATESKRLWSNGERELEDEMVCPDCQSKERHRLMLP